MGTMYGRECRFVIRTVFGSEFAPIAHNPVLEANQTKRKSTMEKDVSIPKDTPTTEVKTESMSTAPQVLEQVQAELVASNDKYLRLYSEFENFRRRVAKEKLALIDTACEDILRKLLPVVDDFERALASLQADEKVPQAMQAGVQLIYEKLMHLLQQAGVQPMLLDKGAVFDTEFHEAVTQVPVEGEDMQGKVLDVLEKGYFLKEKILRFAKVVTGA